MGRTHERFASQAEKRDREGALVLLRAYACAAGMVLVSLGAVGVVLGIPGVGVPQDLLYLFSGGIFLYEGLWQIHASTIRTMICGIGMLYLFAGVLVFCGVFLLDLPDLGGISLIDDGAHVAFGIVSILLGCLWPSGESSSEPETPSRTRNRTAQRE